jgi:hypothetical protein
MPLSREHARTSCFQIAISRFESSRPSQPVLGPFRTHGLRFIPKTWVALLVRRDLQGVRSPYSQTQEMRGQFAESLRPLSRIFPFSGDSRRRPGSITLRGGRGTHFEAHQAATGPCSIGQRWWPMSGLGALVDTITSFSWKSSLRPSWWLPS